MLITFVAALVALQGAPQDAPQETAVQVVEKALAHYAEARTIAGTVALKQQARGVIVKSETLLQFDKPSKIVLRQVYNGFEPIPDTNNVRPSVIRRALISDGKTFSFDLPDGVRGKGRSIERVSQNGHSQTIQDLYETERLSLVDKNPMLDMAIGRSQDLRRLLDQWASMKLHGKVKVGEQDVTAVTGSFREDVGAAVSGTFEAYFSKDYDLVRYVLKQRFTVPNQPEQIVEVLSIWDSSLKVNAPVDASAFVVSN
ncbi:MAG TPA: hypothetical protein VK934_08470 [Fimbriimonas sp.]|nr:hypothetical protein [Fimbriimonas sp.]